jgi:pyruvate/2-oxoglutarate dehydrogenase complex dihydrolipoamide acyltransferase (E2) component
MARPILMPQVGQDLTEGIVTAIHVKLGDQVKKGDIVAEVESEKAAFEVEAFETGTVLKIHYKVGDMAVVLEPLMMVGTAAEAGETAASAKADEEASGAEPQATIVDVGEKIPPAEPACATAGSDRVRSSPLARRLSSQAGVDLASISGTGPHAAVVKRDVEAFLCNLAPVDDAALPLPRREASPAGLASLKTLQAGTGDPVLFIHGFGSELSAWRPFIAQLGLGNPILAIDLPGHGGAAGVGTMNFEDLVASVRVALAKDRVEHLHLVGHSPAGMISTCVL